VSAEGALLREQQVGGLRPEREVRLTVRSHVDVPEHLLEARTAEIRGREPAASDCHGAEKGSVRHAISVPEPDAPRGVSVENELVVIERAF
jgi:hypothetical protein